MQCEFDKIKLHRGEIRKLTLEVKSCKDEAFSILKAEINIKQYQEVLLEITPTVEEHDIFFTLDTSNLEPGKYDIECQYVIADEVLIDIFELEVK